MKLKTIFRIEYKFTYNSSDDKMFESERKLNSIDYDTYPSDETINLFIDQCMDLYTNITYGELKVEKIIITTKLCSK